MNNELACRAEIVAQRLAKEDGRGFPAVLFHSKAYEIITNNPECLTDKETKQFESITDYEQGLDELTKDEKEFEELPASKQIEITAALEKGEMT